MSRSQRLMSPSTAHPNGRTGTAGDLSAWENRAMVPGSGSGLAKSVAALVLLPAVVVGLAACGTVRRGAGAATGPGGVAAGGSRSAPASPVVRRTADGGGCPAAIGPPPEGAPVATRAGHLVPPGATGALVCAYFSRDGRSAQALIDTHTPHGSAADLVTYLDALPTDVPAPQVTSAPGQRAVHVCNLMGTPEYWIVLTYPDGTAAIVDIDPSCGTVAYDGAVRYLTDGTLTDLGVVRDRGDRRSDRPTP